MDIHAADSEAAGWLVEGNGRTLSNVQTVANAVGLRITGHNNTARGGRAENNAQEGILVQGNGNVLDDNDAFGNGSHGIKVTGDGNVLLKSDAGDPGNLADGINVNGRGNLLQENDAFANAGNGIVVAGGTAASPNVLKKNRAGDKGKGNAGNGFLIGGTGNGTSNPIEIIENSAGANRLNGLHVTGTGHQLKNNRSGGVAASENNGDCEYLIAAGNFNAGGNKTNNVIGALSIPGCTGTP